MARISKPQDYPSSCQLALFIQSSPPAPFAQVLCWPPRSIRTALSSPPINHPIFDRFFNFHFISSFSSHATLCLRVQTFGLLLEPMKRYKIRIRLPCCDSLPTLHLIPRIFFPGFPLSYSPCHFHLPPMALPLVRPLLIPLGFSQMWFPFLRSIFLCVSLPKTRFIPP